MYRFSIFCFGTILCCWGLVGCGVSRQAFMASEVMRVQFERENQRLRQDTTLLGMMYRNANQSNQDLVEKMSRITIDTTNQGKQIREYKKYLSSLQQTENIAEKLNYIKDKEARLLEWENRLQTETETNPTGSSKVVSPAEIERLFEECKQELGVYSVDKVTIQNMKENVTISVPHFIFFDTQSSTVQGKGIALLIKLSEILKSEPFSIQVVTCAMPDKRVSLGSSELWDLAAKRGSSIAQILERYGVSNAEIQTQARVLSVTAPSSKLITKIIISHKTFP